MGTAWDKLIDKFSKFKFKDILPTLIYIVVFTVLVTLFFLIFTKTAEYIMLVSQGEIIKDFGYWFRISLFRTSLYILPVLLTFIFVKNQPMYKGESTIIKMIHIFYFEFVIFMLLGSLYAFLSLDSVFADSIFSWASSVQGIIIFVAAIFIESIISKKKTI